MTSPTDIDEAQTREQIDLEFMTAEWTFIQDKSHIYLIEPVGVAVWKWMPILTTNGQLI